MKRFVAINHALYEFKNILRNPEQLLLILGTPSSLMIIFGDQKGIVPFTLAACALSSSFTSVAINTAFAKRYGTLKYFSVTPVGIKGLVIGQTLVGLLLLCLQIPFVLVLAVFLKIEISMANSAILAIPLLVVLFTLLAFNFASLMSAEKVLAFANVTFILIIASGLKLIGQDFGIFHPLAGIAFRDAIGADYLISLLVYVSILALALRKFFRWID